MTKHLYFDYMATTPIDPRVSAVMMESLGAEQGFGNPASHTHSFGIAAKERVEKARGQVASLINADPKEIIWTSGATEANNLAIKGAAHFYRRKGKHIITMSTEHKAVLDTCDALADAGYEITYLSPNTDGTLDLEALSGALRQDTLLVSIMHVNNETGVIQDLDKIAQIVKSQGALLHTDAAQSNGKVNIDVTKTPFDLISLCAHKIYGPKGIGALYVRSQPQLRLTPFIHGGGHERGLRSGTLATHQIAGMGEAFDIAAREMRQDTAHAKALTDQIWTILSQTDAIWNGYAASRVPNCMNLTFPGIRFDTLMMNTPGLAYSSISACNSVTPKPSHVLTAMGVSPQLADCSVRISVGRFTKEADIPILSEAIFKAWQRLK